MLQCSVVTVFRKCGGNSLIRPIFVADLTEIRKQVLPYTADWEEWGGSSTFLPGRSTLLLDWVQNPPPGLYFHQTQISHPVTGLTN